VTLRILNRSLKQWRREVKLKIFDKKKFGIKKEVWINGEEFKDWKTPFIFVLANMEEMGGGCSILPPWTRIIFPFFLFSQNLIFLSFFPLPSLFSSYFHNLFFHLPLSIFFLSPIFLIVLSLLSCLPLSFFYILLF